MHGYASSQNIRYALEVPDAPWIVSELQLSAAATYRRDRARWAGRGLPTHQQANSLKDKTALLAYSSFGCWIFGRQARRVCLWRAYRITRYVSHDYASMSQTLIDASILQDYRQSYQRLSYKMLVTAEVDLGRNAFAASAIVTLPWLIDTRLPHSCSVRFGHVSLRNIRFDPNGQVVQASASRGILAATDCIRTRQPCYPALGAYPHQKSD